jgi:hypothetical protein
MADNAASQNLFFVGIASFTWRPHRLHRVYVRGHELFFIYLGSTIEMSPVTATQFGVAGTLLGGALASRATQKRSRLLEQVEAMKERPLEELLTLHKYSFPVHPDDLEAASLEPFGLWRRLLYRREKQTGWFRFRHRSRGRFTLEFPTREEMHKALEWLPAALGELLQVRVAWDERRQQFVRRGPDDTSVRGCRVKK